MDWLLDIGLSNAVGATLFALVAASVGFVCRRPALTHGLWLIVLVKLVAPPLLSLHFTWPGSMEAERPLSDAVTTPANLASAPLLERSPMPGTLADTPRIETPLNIPVKQVVMEEPPRHFISEVPLTSELTNEVLPPSIAVENQTPPAEVQNLFMKSWRQGVAVVWLTGSLLWWMVAGFRIYQFRRFLRFAEPAPASLQGQVHQLAIRLGLSRWPEVWLFPASTPPLLWAMGGSPRLLLPAALWPQMTVAQQETILAHELAHYRRRDHWVRYLELLALGLYWWHPLVWWARRELQEAEEQCCDAWVVWAMPDAAEIYATALLETVKFLSLPQPTLPVGASGIGCIYSLKRRLIMILQGTTPRALTPPALALLLGCGAVFLSFHLVWAADQAEPAPGVRAAPPAVADSPRADQAPATIARPGGATRNSVEAEAPAADAGRGRIPEDLEEAREDAELLKLQLEAKKAELDKAEALLQQAHHALDRNEKLHAKGTIADGELQFARTEVLVQEATVRGKKAQWKETELRLKQATRRISRIEQGAQGREDLQRRYGHVGVSRNGARNVPSSNARDYSARPDAALNSIARGQEGAPNQNTPDGRAGPLNPLPPLAGARANPPYDGLRLGINQSLAPSKASARNQGEDPQRRMERLERQLGDLMKEVQALRREVHPGPTPGGAATPLAR